MMEADLKALLKDHGWHLFKRVRGDREYFYAQKWKKGEFYVTSQNNLPNLTKEKVLEKIAKAS